MLIKNIICLPDLEELPDTMNDNIDVFAETEDGRHFTVTVCTPAFYTAYMDREGLNYVPSGPPDIIVRELTYENIEKALDDFCRNDGFWLKIYSM